MGQAHEKREKKRRTRWVAKLQPFKKKNFFFQSSVRGRASEAQGLDRPKGAPGERSRGAKAWQRDREGCEEVEASRPRLARV